LDSTWDLLNQDTLLGLSLRSRHPHHFNRERGTIMTAKFQEIIPENGFDPTANPPWIMIGLQMQDTVRLVDGPNLKVVSRDPSMVEIQETVLST